MKKRTAERWIEDKNNVRKFQHVLTNKIHAKYKRTGFNNTKCLKPTHFGRH